MEIKQYIYDLLFTQDCVILPKLGAFKTITESATIDETSQTITPIRTRVVFDESLNSTSENLLAQTISQGEGIGIELAMLEVEVFISDIQSRLLSSGTASIEGIGTLTQGAKGKIVFQEEENTNFHPDAFGLSPIKFVGNSQTTSPKMTQTIKQETPTKKRRSLKWLVWLVVILLIGGLGFYAYKAGYVQYAKDFIAKRTQSPAADTSGLSDNTSEIEDDLAKSLKEDSNIQKIDSTVQKQEIKNTGEQEKKEPEKEQSQKSSKLETTDAKFFIIESSFGDSIHAYKRSNDLKSKGYNSQVMPKENNSFRVSMGAFTNRSTAIIELERIKSQDPKLKVWIYKK